MQFSARVMPGSLVLAFTLCFAVPQVQPNRGSSAHVANSALHPAIPSTDNSTKNKTFAYVVPAPNINSSHDGNVIVYVNQASTTSNTTSLFNVSENAVMAENSNVTVARNESENATMTPEAVTPPEVDEGHVVSVGLAAGLTITAAAILLGCVLLAWYLRKQVMRDDGIWYASRRIPMTASRKRWLSTMASDEQALST